MASRAEMLDSPSRPLLQMGPFECSSWPLKKTCSSPLLNNHLCDISSYYSGMETGFRKRKMAFLCGPFDLVFACALVFNVDICSITSLWWGNAKSEGGGGRVFVLPCLPWLCGVRLPRLRPVGRPCARKVRRVWLPRLSAVQLSEASW